ncbi:hypothetical protein KKF47_00760 [Patescibacteria group bacterium]|nr:hypothetical protein [Patescibacteria group bacterium]
MKKVFLIILAIIVVTFIIGGIEFLWQQSREEKPEVIVTNFEECAATGSPVMESYPRQCRYGEQTFVEVIEDGEGILPFDSGVFGKVLLGPICPVMKDPPDPNCADKPYQTQVQVILSGSPQSSPFAVVESDENGNYKAMLPPGEYGLQAVGKLPFLFCATKEIIVEPNIMSEVALSCDTGIR